MIDLTLSSCASTNVNKSTVKGRKELSKLRKQPLKPQLEGMTDQNQTTVQSGLENDRNEPEGIRKSDRHINNVMKKNQFVIKLSNILHHYFHRKAT